jgi:isochorismate synthase
MELPALINVLQEKNQAFVCYRLPYLPEPVCLKGGKFTEMTNQEDIADLEGFIIAPFTYSPDNPFLLYKDYQSLEGWNPDGSDLVFAEHAGVPSSATRIHPIIDFQEYTRQANHMVSALREGSLQKVVLSRIIRQELPEAFLPGEFFKALCLEYPGAFVYLFNDGKGRCWAGATPEVLLEVEKGQGQTMSLAATLPAKKGGSHDLEWQKKEKEEQFLVTQFIRDKLIDSDINDFIEAELETSAAGPVVHLLKRFCFKLPAGFPALKLALSLHPTPAVCGLPLEQARQEILGVETHDRSYYSGFLGPVSNKTTTRLFVNLRCMQIIDKNAFIFVGGGLLAESDIEREWQETELKAETLLSVIRKLN